MSRATVHIAALLLSVIALTSCTTPTEATTTAVDAGNYPTAPAPAAEPDSVGDRAILRAEELSDYLVSAVEVDPKLTYNYGVDDILAITPTSPPRDTRLGAAEFSTAAPGLIAGWRTEGHRRGTHLYGANLTITLLEFTDSVAAAAAAERLAASRFDSNLRMPVPIPGHSGAKAHTLLGSTELDAWLSAGKFMIYVGASNPNMNPVDQSVITALVATTLDKQVDAVAAIPLEPTAVAERDEDGLIERTLPMTELPNGNGEVPSVYSVRGATHVEYLTREFREALLAAGVDLAVRSDARVYRAQDPSAATRLQQRLIEIQLTSQFLGSEATSIDPPPGLPAADCVEIGETDLGPAKVPFLCVVSAGRYVGVVRGTQEQVVYQKAAAQYLLLAAE